MEDDRDITECRSALYGLLANVYLRIPEGETLSVHWDPALRLLEFPQKGTEKPLQDVQEGLNLIKDYLSTENPPAEERLLNLSRDWTRLFRGVDVKGPLPPYESLYRTGRTQKEPVRQINRLFSGMGIRIPEEWHQPPDYIGVELDFMRLLCAKEREARKKTETDALHGVLTAERSFLEHHLALWAPVFCKKMMEQAREGFYRGIARLTRGLVEYDRIYLRNILSKTD